MQQSKGILCYSNQTIEWMIPWWIDNIQKTNVFPIAIIDNGLSPKMRSWCEQRAQLIPFNPPAFSIAGQSEITQERIALWERQYNGDLWTARQSWFLKPFVLQLTPFQKSLYLDLDCEVKMPLNSLFNMDTPFAVALETTRTDLFNSGVILYEKNSPILHAWKEEVQTKNHLHMGDQDILSALIETQQFKWDLLDKTYNMRPAFTADLDHAAIVHRVGLVGKRDIMAQMIERITH